MAKIETTFIRPKELYTPETGETKVVYDGYQNNPHELVVQENLESDVSEIVNDTFVPNEGGNVVFTDNNETEHELITEDGFPIALAKAQVIETTWQELKDKRDNGELNPGSLYRITDYNCTTTQENTQSAGHQFDIVLLALSEDKLAEEGWAMEHPSDVYDVTFTDDVTKKCYVYTFINARGDEETNLVDVETLLGTYIDLTDPDVTVDKKNKTIVIDGAFDFPSTNLTEENLPYNYFQNSNLSAWKVWYCLDNDTARFAWADDSVDEGSPAYITYLGTKEEEHILFRDENDDTEEMFAWKEPLDNSIPFYTASQTPNVGDVIFDVEGLVSDSTVNSYTPAHEGTGEANGRGVIYRLIDEFNNDVAYDFKNIQYVRKLTDGHIDAQGSDTWCYTFNAYFDGDVYDYSIVSAIWKNDEDTFDTVMNNIIYGIQSNNDSSRKLNDFVFNADGAEPDVYSVQIKNNLFLMVRDGGSYEGTALRNSIFLDTTNSIIYNGTLSGIIFQNKKAVFETII